MLVLGEVVLGFMFDHATTDVTEEIGLVLLSLLSNYLADFSCYSIVSFVFQMRNCPQGSTCDKKT
jgi:hypothetical protein